MKKTILLMPMVITLILGCKKLPSELPSELKSDFNNKSEKIKEEHRVSPLPFCQDDPNPIGGGVGYSNVYTPQMADIVISSFSGLLDFKNIIESASPSTVIYIMDDVVINASNMISITGEPSIYVPEGVTICSGRGSSGDGALIYTTDFEYELPGSITLPPSDPLFVVKGNNVKFSGLRIQGPSTDLGGDPDDYEAKYKTGIQIVGYQNLEVDNCEFYAWPYAAVSIGNESEIGASYEENLIHHNYIHHNRQNGYGYGVTIANGYAIIFSNVFEADRHDIAGSGYKGSGYEAYCNNVLEGGTGHNFDMHGAGSDKEAYAGKYIYIHHNYFIDIGSGRTGDKPHRQNIGVRGRPDTQCRIENNIFNNDGPESSIYQSKHFGHMLVWNNIYGGNHYLGWYVKSHWSKYNASNVFKFESSNDWFIEEYKFGDYDGDGKTDIYEFDTKKSTVYTIPYETGTSSGLTTEWTPILSSGYDYDRYRIDFFDSDNKSDLMVQDGNTIYISYGANTTWIPVLTTSYSLDDLMLGNIDGNPRTDLILTTNSLWRVSYDANSPWQIFNNSGYTSSSLLVGKFNNDNKDDIFLADGTNFNVSYGGTSAWVGLASSGYPTSSLILADFDGDNISDVINPVSREVSFGGLSNWNQCLTSNYPLSSFSYGNF